MHNLNSDVAVYSALKEVLVRPELLSDEQKRVARTLLTVLTYASVYLHINISRPGLRNQ